MSALLPILQQIKPTISSHKIEILTAFAFALAALFLPYKFLEANFEYWLFSPLYLVVIYLSRYNKFAYKCSILVPIIGSFLVYALEYKSDFYFHNEKFWAVYTIAAIALLADKFAKDDEGFIKNVISKILNLALAFGIFALLAIIISLIIAAFDYFFDTDLYRVNFLVNFHVANFIALVPFLFLLFEDKFYFRDSNQLLKNILNFILTPTLIIYTGILYLYMANIAFISGLPKGGVAIIVLIYLLAGFILTALDSVVNLGSSSTLKTSKISNFYNFFAYLGSATLILLWVGILERTDTYGLTPSRIYLISAATLATITYILMMVKRLFSYRICAVISVSLILITFFVIDARGISLNSQISRLHAYLNELNLTDQNGEIKKIDISNLSSNDKIKLTDMAYAIKNLDDNYSLPNNENLLNELTHYGYLPRSAKEATEYRSLKLSSTQIALSGYKNLIVDSLNYEREALQEQGFIEIFKDDQKIISINMNDHIKRVFEKRGLDFYTIYSYEILNQLADDLLVIYTDKGVLVIDWLELKVNPSQGYTLLRATPAFFLEKE
ncbi:DUF4153 domain-containing protein [Campylobacter sp. RM16188]|uniref:DUF4153 domain-containing protein n=1 Tax=Campylobacter sp. RM16188 TaxID=1705725 RepID=UPI001551FB2B|nr:DUF4153 domain-containing protein [Campylobacter sp. RM16188]